MAEIAVVGASLGGLRAAEHLRAAGWQGGITVYGDEPHLPYNRPPLSKDVLAGHTAPEATRLRRRASTEDVTWRLGTAVTAADLTARTLTLADGSVHPYDGLVAASGIRPRRLDCPAAADGPGRHTVRTLEDAEGLRSALVPGARVVVVGAGFIGCEVAATARAAGCEVTVVAPEDRPLARALGDDLAQALRRRHERRGVRFALGRTVAELTGHGLRLDDATVLPADAVVEAIGSLPNTAWLEGNALDLTDGVLCDGHLRVGGLPHAVAVGDVARFPNARYGPEARRVEHWSIPGDTARRAARTLVAGLTGEDLDGDAFAPLPSFWSDQFDLRLQSFGAPALADRAVLLEGAAGDDTDDTGDLLYGYYREGRLIAVTSLGGQQAAASAARRRSELLALEPPVPA